MILFLATLRISVDVSHSNTNRQPRRPVSALKSATASPSNLRSREAKELFAGWKQERSAKLAAHSPAFNLHNLHHRHRHLWSSFSNHVSPLRRSTNGSFCLLHAHNLAADRRCVHTWSKLDTSLIFIFPCLDLNWKILRQLRRTSLDWLARWKIMEIGVWPSKATPPKRNPKCEASSCANFCFAVSSPRHQNFWFSFYRESEAARKSQPTLGGVGASSIAEKKCE